MTTSFPTQEVLAHPRPSLPSGTGRIGAALRGKGRIALLLPALAFLGLFFVYPLLGLVLRSLSPKGQLSYTRPELTLSNYGKAIGNLAYRLILKETFVFAFVATVATMIVSYPVALFLSRCSMRATKFALAALVAPYFTSILIRLYAFTQILRPLGLLYTTTGAIVGMVNYLVPYMVVILYASMSAIDADLSVAARSLGARPSQAFRRVFFPLTRNTLITGGLLVFVMSLGFYLTPAVLGSGSKITVAFYVQQQVDNYAWAMASTMGVIMLALTLVVFAVVSTSDVERLIAKSTGKGVSRRATFRWRPANVALGLWTLAVLLFLLLPLLVVVLVSFTNVTYLRFPPPGWSLRWYREVFRDPVWVDAALLSLRIALGTTVITTLIGTMAAFGLERGRRRGRSAFLRALFILPIIVPSILIGASLFDLESRLRISGTTLGYVIGHTIIALPVVIIIVSIALRNADASLELAARSLGASPLAAFRRITLPMIAPAVGAAAVFAFLASWDEVVIAMFVSGFDKTLPVTIFLTLNQQLRPTIAAVATLLMAALVLLWIFISLLRRVLTMRPTTGWRIDAQLDD
ncbi:MAG: ABC transporter permease subunit [Ilumatobacteraceae bacterium]